MESLWPIGYIGFAAFFYAFSMKSAPIIEDMDEATTPFKLHKTEIIELFPAAAEERKAA